MRAPKIANHGRNQTVSEEALEEAICNQEHPFPGLSSLLLLLSEVLLYVAAAEGRAEESDYSNNLGNEIRGCGGMCASGKVEGEQCSTVQRSAVQCRPWARARAQLLEDAQVDLWERCRRKGVGYPRVAGRKWSVGAGWTCNERATVLYALYIGACVRACARECACVL